MVGDEADRRDEDMGLALRVERLEMVEDVGAEPGSPVADSDWKLKLQSRRPAS